MSNSVLRVVPRPAFVIAGLAFLVPVICLSRDNPWIGAAVGAFASRNNWTQGARPERPSAAPGEDHRFVQLSFQQRSDQGPCSLV
jgi:hypothetical protein